MTDRDYEIFKQITAWYALYYKKYRHAPFLNEFNEKMKEIKEALDEKDKK